MATHMLCLLHYDCPEIPSHSAPLPFSAMADCSPMKDLLEKSLIVSLLIIDTDGHMGLGKRNYRICNSPKSSFQSYECFMSFFHSLSSFQNTVGINYFS